MVLNYYERLNALCTKKKSRLCIGLDLDLDKVTLDNVKDLEDLESFAKDIIDATCDICAVYKPNFAFYERYGYKGFKILENIVSYIGDRAIKLADTKRGDIGNTCIKYAESIFGYFDFDATTISPYMGRDSITPFIQDSSKGAYILCLTSNESAYDFQYKFSNNKHLFEDVAIMAESLNRLNNIGLVVGATKSEEMLKIKNLAPSLTWLIPGIGAQGGSLKDSVHISRQHDGLGIINVSRGIIYAGKQSIEDIYKAANKYRVDINKLLDE